MFCYCSEEKTEIISELQEELDEVKAAASKLRAEVCCL